MWYCEPVSFQYAKCVCVVPGLEDDGFEALEQLSYLYLANNKVRSEGVAL